MPLITPDRSPLGSLIRTTLGVRGTRCANPENIEYVRGEQATFQDLIFPHNYKENYSEVTLRFRFRGTTWVDRLLKVTVNLVDGEVSSPETYTFRVPELTHEASDSEWDWELEHTLDLTEQQAAFEAEYDVPPLPNAGLVPNEARKVTANLDIVAYQCEANNDNQTTTFSDAIDYLFPADVDVDVDEDEGGGVASGVTLVRELQSQFRAFARQIDTIDPDRPDPEDLPWEATTSAEIGGYDPEAVEPSIPGVRVQNGSFREVSTVRSYPKGFVPQRSQMTTIRQRRFSSSRARHVRRSPDPGTRPEDSYEAFSSVGHDTTAITVVGNVRVVVVEGSVEQLSNGGMVAPTQGYPGLGETSEIISINESSEGVFYVERLD